MRRVAWLVLACLVAAALYVTGGVLDERLIDGVRTRIAFLPPWEAAAGLLLAVTCGLAIASHAARAAKEPEAAAVGNVLVPLLGAAVLLLPFLPVVPDLLPALQILAGPLRAIVWLGAAALVLWTWRQSRGAASRHPRRSLTLPTMAVALATALVCGAAASRLTGTLLYPAGDEPHYLVIAQSLWRDGDFKIENNHARGDYLEYFAQKLDPHYLTRGADGEIYSIHPVGLPILLAPIYAVAGYQGVVWSLIALAAAAAALAWRWTAATLGSTGGATYAWAAVALTTPYLFNSFAVYPEIAAGLAVMIGITTRRPMVLGIACGVLPWLSTKYAPMSAVLLATGLVTGYGPGTWRLAPLRAMAGAALPYAALVSGWFAFFYVIWGSPLPQSPYGAMVQTTPRNLVFGAPGLLFDQEYGLLPYAPAFILAVTGLWSLWRSGGERRALALRVLLVFAALLGTVGAFRIWWGGSASPSRPLASGLLLLVLPVAAAFLDAPARSAARAGQHLLLWIGLGIAVQLAVAQDGFLLANGRDGTSSLVEWWLPRWETWSLLPSFIHHEAGTALLHSAAWLAIAAAGATVLRRWRTPRPGVAAVAAQGVLAACLIAGAVIVPLLPHDPPQPIPSLETRARIDALAHFDATARPAALVYRPLSKTAAPDQLGGFTLTVTPGSRPEPQPIRVLHNGRFSLPAGTYRADVAFASGARAGRQAIALQLGRTGPPMATWAVDPADATWTTTFTLPADIGFVGFRGERGIEQAIERITLTPLAVVDESRRPRLPPVLAAAKYGETLALFHDDWTAPEPPGFWIIGRRPTRLTFAPHSGETPVTLRLRSDEVANHVRLSAPGWQQEIDLAAGTPASVPLPPASRGVITVEIETSAGFVPSERDRSLRDRRFLGVWVEVE